MNVRTNGGVSAPTILSICSMTCVAWLLCAGVVSVSAFQGAKVSSTISQQRVLVLPKKNVMVPYQQQQQQQHDESPIRHSLLLASVNGDDTRKRTKVKRLLQSLRPSSPTARITTISTSPALRTLKTTLATLSFSLFLTLAPTAHFKPPPAHAIKYDTGQKKNEMRNKIRKDERKAEQDAIASRSAYDKCILEAQAYMRELRLERAATQKANVVKMRKEQGDDAADALRQEYKVLERYRVRDKVASRKALIKQMLSDGVDPGSVDGSRTLFKHDYDGFDPASVIGTIQSNLANYGSSNPRAYTRLLKQERTLFKSQLRSYRQRDRGRTDLVEYYYITTMNPAAKNMYGIVDPVIVKETVEERKSRIQGYIDAEEMRLKRVEGLQQNKKKRVANEDPVLEAKLLKREQKLEGRRKQRETELYQKLGLKTEEQKAAEKVEQEAAAREAEDAEETEEVTQDAKTAAVSLSGGADVEMQVPMTTYEMGDSPYYELLDESLEEDADADAVTEADADVSIASDEAIVDSQDADYDDTADDDFLEDENNFNDELSSLPPIPSTATTTTTSNSPFAQVTRPQQIAIFSTAALGAGYGVKIYKVKKDADEKERQRQFNLIMGLNGDTPKEDDDEWDEDEDDDDDDDEDEDDDDENDVAPPKTNKVRGTMIPPPTGLEEDDSIVDTTSDFGVPGLELDDNTPPTPADPTPAAPKKKEKKKKRAGVKSLFQKNISQRETNLDKLLSDSNPQAPFCATLTQLLTFGAPGRFPNLETLAGPSEFILADAQTSLVQTKGTLGVSDEDAAESFANVVNCMIIDIVDLASSALKLPEKAKVKKGAKEGAKGRDEAVVDALNVVLDFMDHAATLFDAAAGDVSIEVVTYQGKLSKSKLEQMYGTYVGSNALMSMDPKSQERSDTLQLVFAIPDKKAAGIQQRRSMGMLMKMMKNKDGDGGMPGMEEMMKGMGGMEGMEELMKGMGGEEGGGSMEEMMAAMGGEEGMEEMMKSMGGMEGMDELMKMKEGEEPSPEQLKQSITMMKQMMESGSLPPEAKAMMKKQYEDQLSGLSEGDLSALGDEERELLRSIKEMMDS